MGREIINVSNSTNDKAGAWIGVGTAIGAAVYVITKNPVWIGAGVAIGAAIGWTSQKNQK